MAQRYSGRRQWYHCGITTNDGWLHSSQKEDCTTVFIPYQGTSPYLACTGTNVPKPSWSKRKWKDWLFILLHLSLILKIDALDFHMFSPIPLTDHYLLLWQLDTMTSTWFRLNPWQQGPYIQLCLEVIREWVWTGHFSEQGDPATVFLRNPYLKVVCSPSADSKYFCTSKHLFIHLSISRQCAVINTFNWIIHYDDMPVHIYHTDKFVSASLAHSSFNSPLIHWVIWRTNIPPVREREKRRESMQKLLQAYKSKHTVIHFVPTG